MIEKFKQYLDAGTNAGLRFNDESLSRYVSFSKCLESLKKINYPDKQRVLELGTSRSFVDGRFEGCNSDDKKYWQKDRPEMWDWGAGCFTLVFGLAGQYVDTVDLISSHIHRCEYMTDSLCIYNVTHYVENSLNFLRDTLYKYDLIYLDTGDMWPIETSIELQLQESQIIVERNLLTPNGLILIDDVMNGTPREMGDKTNKFGKSEKSLPFLQKNGFKVDFAGYQYILSKSK